MKCGDEDVWDIHNVDPHLHFVENPYFHIYTLTGFLAPSLTSHVIWENLIFS